MRQVAPGDILDRIDPAGYTLPTTHTFLTVERPAGGVWVSPGIELDHLNTYVSDVVIPTLVTGLALPGALPREIDLGDNAETPKERISRGGWTPGHQSLSGSSSGRPAGGNRAATVVADPGPPGGV